MNILELCLSTGFGGLELYVFRSACALNASNRVLAVLNQNSRLAEHFKNNSDISTLYLHWSKSYFPLVNAYRLAKIIDQHEIDAIHMHWGNDLALAAFAKKLSTKKPALIYTRQMQITRSKDDFYHNMLYQQMSRMLTISRRLENDARRFIKKYADNITTLYYGVNEPAHFPDDNERKMQREEIGFQADDFVVGLFGRLEENKGQHLLIKAIARAQRDGLDIHGLIIGHEMDEGYRDTLKQMTIDQGIADKVVFMDFVNNPQQLMQLCDCVVLATYEETFGLVLAEAMRAGVAVIGSNSGGVPEIIEHNKTGLLFESRNEEDLYQKISTLYNDPELKQRLAAQGKESADIRFNTAAHFEKLEGHIIECVN
ncbi:MAG: glycosyltransferase family 4 protein [Gammaproteobacteria bacterium]|nr:glycosyltransferase family 4 protein [Gammaproteobacteria bacterium]